MGVNEKLVAKHRKGILDNVGIVTLLKGASADPALNYSVASFLALLLIKTPLDNMPKVLKFYITELIAFEKAAREEEINKLALKKTTEEIIKQVEQPVEIKKQEMNLDGFKNSIKLIFDEYAKSQEEKELLKSILNRIKIGKEEYVLKK